MDNCSRIRQHSTNVACAAAAATTNAWPFSAAQAEPDNLRTLTAVMDTPAQRTESALYG
jgi:hypothetical protein